jgi:DNA polymerase III sliding clamp (beta) subunit (PCNA family)
MGMIVDREELVAALKAVKPGIAKQEIIEQSACIIFDAESKRAYTFNDELACFIKLDIGITGAVVASTLLDLLGKLKDEEIEVSQDDTHFTIKCKRSESGVQCERDIRLPIDTLEHPNKEDWKRLPENFKNAVAMAESCVSTADTDIQMSSIHVTPTHLEAANMSQMCRFTIDMPITGSFLVRHGNLDSIAKIGVTHCAETENWLHFKGDGGLRISCRKFNEEYIEDFDSILEKIGSMSENADTGQRVVNVVLPSKLKDDVKTAAMFSKDNLSGKDVLTVKLSKEKQCITLKGEGVLGFFKGKARCNYEGDDISFAISPNLLLEILTQYKICTVLPKSIKVSNDQFVFLTSIEAAE